jgi:integrase
MSVHKTASGRFEARWREGSRNRSRTFDRKGDAHAFDARVRRQTQLGESVPARTGSDTLAEFFVHWLANRQHSIAPRTIKVYKELFTVHVFDQLGYAPLTGLSPERLEDWQAERLTAGAGKESIAKTGRLLNQVFKKAVRQGKMPANPVEGMKKPKAKTDRVAPATPEKVEAIRSHLLARKRTGDAVLVSLMAYGGLRVGEALGLQWEDFSQGNRLWISRSLEDDGSLRGTKNSRERMVVLPESAAEDLLAWRREIGLVQGLVFPRAKDGRGWTKTDRNNWNRRHFKPACEAAGISIPPKNLRHSAASLRIAAGKRPTEVAEELGHTLAVSVNVYQRLMREMEGQPIRSVDEMIREARERVEAPNEDRTSDSLVRSDQCLSLRNPNPQNGAVSA